MGLLDFLKPKSKNGQFVSETTFNNIRDEQKHMTVQTMDQLRKLDLAEDEELRLEFFFYTNTLDKAAQFAAELEKLNYKVKYGVSEGDKYLFIITGWTTKMKMTDQVVRKWTNKMCEIGYRFDCDFDGWGTNPGQNETN